MTTTWVRVGYGAVLGVLLAVTVAMGVAVGTIGPRPPQPLGLTFQQLSGNTTEAESNRIASNIDGFYQDAQNYRAAYPDYQRNVFLWYAGFGILFAVIGTALPAVVNYLRFGFVLGGLLLIAAGTWFALQPVPTPVSQNASSLLSLIPAGTPKVLDTAGRFLRFAVAVVGLLVMLFVGLWRLTDWNAMPVRLVAAPPAPPPYPSAVYPSPGAPPSPSAPPPVPAPASDSLRWAPPEVRASPESPPPVPETVTTEPAAPVVAPPDSGNVPSANQSSESTREGA